MKQHFLYLEDVKTAMNIHHLEVSINLKKWMKEEMKRSLELQRFLEVLDESIEKDRHRMQKTFKISI